MSKVNASFDYIVQEDNALEDLPNSLYGVLANLFNEGYLIIKPTKVDSHFYTREVDNVKKYQVDMSFDTDDKERIKDAFFRPKVQ